MIMHEEKPSYCLNFLAGHDACTSRYDCSGVVPRSMDAILGVDRDASTGYKENISFAKRFI